MDWKRKRFLLIHVLFLHCNYQAHGREEVEVSRPQLTSKKGTVQYTKCCSLHLADTSFSAWKIQIYIVTVDDPRCVQLYRNAFPAQLVDNQSLSQSAFFTKMRQSKCAIVFLITRFQSSCPVCPIARCRFNHPKMRKIFTSLRKLSNLSRRQKKINNAKPCKWRASKVFGLTAVEVLSAGRITLFFCFSASYCWIPEDYQGDYTNNAADGNFWDQINRSFLVQTHVSLM